MHSKFVCEPVGDLHNFGAAVQKTLVNGCLYYNKPRTMFWENLFFGNESPIKSVFKNTPIYKNFCISEASVGNTIMQKEILHDDHHKFHFEGFGFLLAYCFCMGLQDIHHQNVVLAAHGVQPVDVEIVFSDLISPSQTILIPGKNIEFRRSALGKFFEFQKDIPKENVIELINGFHLGILRILNSSNDLIRLLPQSKELSKHNNRIIFRNTKQYSDKCLDVIPEEKVQLDRGDIPYFFKKNSSDDVCYFKTKDQIEVVKNLPEKFKKIADAIGKSPQFILSKERLTEKIMPIGLLSLTSSFTRNLTGLTKIPLKEGAIEIAENEIVFQAEKTYVLRL